MAGKSQAEQMTVALVTGWMISIWIIGKLVTFVPATVVAETCLQAIDIVLRMFGAKKKD